MEQKKFPQKILILSDEHRGATYSVFWKYQKNLVEKMAQYDHIVDIGDNAELEYVDKDFARDYGKLIDITAGQGKSHWERKIIQHSKTPSPKIRGVIHAEKKFIEKFLEAHPEITFHTVLGNHENVQRFRNEMDELQKDHANFQWSPEAIQIGDALFTHSHLQLAKQTDAEYPLRHLKDAQKAAKHQKKSGEFTDAVAAAVALEREAKDVTQFRARVESGLYPPIFSVIKWLHDNDKTSRRVIDQLKEWSGTEKFQVMCNRVLHPLDMDTIKHVFFGHTHIKFDNHQVGEIHTHNTGAFTAANVKKNDDLGVLEATLNGDGSITNIQPVRLEKDPVQVAIGR